MLSVVIHDNLDRECSLSDVESWVPTGDGFLFVENSPSREPYQAIKFRLERKMSTSILKRNIRTIPEKGLARAIYYMDNAKYVER